MTQVNPCKTFGYFWLSAVEKLTPALETSELNITAGHSFTADRKPRRLVLSLYSATTDNSVSPSKVTTVQHTILVRMRLKTRGGKRVKVVRATETRVPPVAWEQSKLTSRILYQEAEQLDEWSDWSREIAALLHYRTPTSLTEVFWCGAPAIPRLEFQHAVIQTVEFEWGTHGRPVHSARLQVPCTAVCDLYLCKCR